jgi:hypothetical protein
MNRLIPALLAAASALAISACAFNVPGEKLQERADAARALDRGVVQGNSVDDMHSAQMAAARGDWPVSVALGEQSYRENPSIWNEFNLATAYQNTGHAGQAIPLYTNLIDRGRFIALTPVQNFDGSWPPPMAATVSEEAQARLNRLSGIGAGRHVTDFSYPALGTANYAALGSAGGRPTTNDVGQ